MKRASHWLAAALGASLLAPVGMRTAAADDRDSKLASFEADASEIGKNLPQPNLNPQAASNRRLIDAEVAFSLGDYDTATLMLFELANTPGAEQETARFYLGETLYQKHERGAARRYFQAIVDTNNTSSKYFQPSLLRIIEIAIAHGDLDDIDAQTAMLSRLGIEQSPEAVYVRGKLAFAQGKYDDAIQIFNTVPAGSTHDVAAHYYAAACLVAKQDLGGATNQFTAVINTKPKSSTDRRVIELAQMALGRLYYERDQLARSIDAYLLVDRHSDLFPDALYEVAWVYVKTKQYDKALRALELLALSEPTSTKTPTVRILEGNLRIRKAQLLREAIVAGTIKEEDTSDENTDPDVEYTKATAVFQETHDLYNPGYLALTEIIDANEDPSQFLAQIAGKNQEVFQTRAPIPEAAAQYLAEEPNVQRAVRVEADLDEVRGDLDESEKTLARLETVIGANDRTAVYPLLQNRRMRLGALIDSLDLLRIDLAEEQLKVLGGGGSLGQLTANRRALAASYSSAPTVENATQALRDSTAEGYDTLEKSLGEVSGALDTTQAMAVAIRTYAKSTGENPDTALTAEQTTEVNETLATTSSEAAAISAELADLAREEQLGRDLATVGDEGIAHQREVRRQLIAAIGAEQQGLTASANGRTQHLVDQAQRAQKLSDSLIALEGRIDSMADRGIVEAKVAILREKTNISTYREELNLHEAESRELGGTLLGASFKAVKEKFYDIVVRTDVGTVDVAWAQKEDVQDDLKRLNLSRARELKQLHDEFKDILDGGLPAPGDQPPSMPAPNGESTTPANPPATPPNPGTGTPAGSPDKGGGGDRVQPGTALPTTPTTPAVKPDTKTGSR